MSTPTSLALRLDALSRDELIELAAGALDELPKGHRLRNQADALVAKRKPLPSWCVLLSSDLLPHLIEPLTLRDCAAAAACSMWSGAWRALLRRDCYVHPVPRRIDLSETTDAQLLPLTVAAVRAAVRAAGPPAVGGLLGGRPQRAARAAAAARGADDGRAVRHDGARGAELLPAARAKARGGHHRGAPQATQPRPM